MEIVPLTPGDLSLVESMTDNYKRSLSFDDWESLVKILEMALISVNDGTPVCFTKEG